MHRYPTSQGLALPITELGFEMVSMERGISSRHHLYFERRLYDTPIRHVFRNLIDHVVYMKNEEHLNLHKKFSSPVIPKTGLMIDVLDEYLALNGEIRCVKEKKSNVSYEITEQHWEHLKKEG